MMERAGGKKNRYAVLVGCNYPKTQYELHGCVNDVVGMRETLVRRFGFEASGIELLTDEAGGASVRPSGENIKKALGEMVDKAECGDVLYFHYSGHGTRIPSLKHAHPWAKDEAIVPSDFNLITDVDFRHLVNRLPKGASFTFLSDSCHSGGLIDKEKEQVGPTSMAALENRAAEAVPSGSTNNNTNKSIPPQSLLQHLSAVTNISTGDVATHMLELFGPNSSLAFRLPRGPAASFSGEFLVKPDDGILLSGCQANETSADIPAGAGGKARGAFSSAVQAVLEENGDGAGVGLTNREVVMKARQVLKENGIGNQHPCLYCSDDNANAVFLLAP